MTFKVGNSIEEVIHANAVTVGKSLNPAITLEKWKDMLLASHSTIEFSDFFWLTYKDGRAISHLVRHTKGHPRHAVQSQREDWTKTERPSSDTKRYYYTKWTPYSWREMCKQRLCYKAAQYTRDVVVEAKQELTKSDDVFLQGVGWISAPECVCQFGCPYTKSCGWFEMNKSNFYGLSLKGRYNEYERMMKNG